MKPHFWKGSGGYWFCGTSRLHSDWGLDLTMQGAYAMFKQGGWFNVDSHLSKGTP